MKYLKNLASNIANTVERQFSGLKHPAGWLTDILTGPVNNSGVTVNENTAMQLGAVSAAIGVISNGVATQCLKPFRVTDERTEIAKDHPTYRLLTRRANKNMSAFIVIKLIQSQALRWGNGYGWIEFNNAGFPVAIWPLNPGLTTLYLMEDNTVIYQTTLHNQQTVYLDAEEVIHIKALSSDGYLGISPIRQHAEELGIQIAAQNFGAEFFGNGATVQGILKHPGKLDEPARAAIRNSWASATSGTGNRHKTPVLPDGMDYTRVGIPPEEAQFLQTRQYGDRKVAQIYDIPPHMIGDLKDATFSNITEESINFVRRTLSPWFIQWEQEITYKLLSTKEQNTIHIKFDRSDLLRGTPKDEAEKDVKLVNAGIITRNESRELRGMNPIDGLDEVLVPLNMIKQDEAEKLKTGSDSEGDSDEEPEEKSLIDAMPLLTRFSELLDSAQKRVSRDKSQATWLGGGAERFIQRHLGPIASALGTESLTQTFTEQFIDAQNRGIFCTEDTIYNTLKELTS